MAGLLAAAAAFYGCKSSENLQPKAVKKGGMSAHTIASCSVEAKPSGTPMPDCAPMPAAKTEAKRCNDGKFGNLLYLDGHVTPYDAVASKPAADGINRSTVPAGFNTEEYKYYEENGFDAVASKPLSTFSIDVDTASYANVRRFLQQENKLPPADAVRIEECVNYFSYDYPEPKGDMPLQTSMELAACPWNVGHDLLLIGLQAKKVDREKLPPSNFVFLIDSSGSMTDDMPLVKQSMCMLADQMRPCDRVAIVTYAGSAGLVLPSTAGDYKKIITEKINNLQSGGCTAGAQGINLAYQVAEEYFIKGGSNRVILITDGDFNVGLNSEGELVRMIEKKRDNNVFLTVLGVGMGNYKDNKMQMLADKGNGNYIYLDNIREAQKALVNEMTGNMFAVAKDVKIQIEFNPRFVKGYRLVGYEKRMLADRDFTDDTKDAGEAGVGHQITALYELIPAASEENINAPAPLEFQKTTVVSDKLINFKLRWKTPEGKKSTEWIGYCTAEKAAKPSENFRFASAVAEFGLLLRDSKLKGNASWQQVIDLAQSARGVDRDGNRAEFVKLAETAKLLDNRNSCNKLIAESNNKEPQQ